MVNTVELDERLLAIERLLPEDCRSVADIGTDHGFLGAHLLLTGRAERVWFTDISAVSLRKADRLTRELGLAKRAFFCVGDGAQSLPEAPDAAVIAGMGGVTIAEIIEKGREKLGDARLVLQPNVAIAELRARLYQAGYRLEREEIARAAGRFYVILSARRGAGTLTEREKMAGPCLLRDKTPAFKEYAAFRLRVAEKALRGAKKGQNEGAREALAREAEIWREALTTC